MKTEQLENSERALVDSTFKRLRVILSYYSEEVGSRLGYTYSGHPCGTSFGEDSDELQDAIQVLSRNESLLTTEEAARANTLIKEAEKLLEKISRW